MSKIKKISLFILAYFGFYPNQLWGNFTGFIGYISDIFEFKSKMKLSEEKFWKFKYYPILLDKKEQSGKAFGQYFYQDLYVASLIYAKNPKRHIDIGSRIDGFITHLATFRLVEVFDIRPLDNVIDNVKFIQADLMNPLQEMLECTDSLSCLHTIEHFGLGRYSDPIDFDGHLKGLNSMYSILAKNGFFYFSTQMGPNTIAFNAHRIFSLKYLLQLFENKYTIDEFSYIDDSNQLNKKVNLTKELIENNCGCKLGVAIFVLIKN